MIPGFTGNAASVSGVSLAVGASHSGFPHQGVALAGIPQPGCTVECYCSLFTYKCYERCDGRVIRAWDGGWCVSW
jgi:hypothetical protein